ncbi:hypothetical protein K449DRAFT_427628 [Hypoxylon sp. EC38]|nr:hypothetical protein K449DRAFT_427628 [Hypoxylon sp. EC38]
MQFGELQHKFEVELKGGTKQTRTSTLCEYDSTGPGSYSAIAKLIAFKQVLDGTLSEKGVLAPMNGKINNPLIKELKEAIESGKKRLSPDRATVAFAATVLQNHLHASRSRKLLAQGGTIWPRTEGIVPRNPKSACALHVRATARGLNTKTMSIYTDGLVGTITNLLSGMFSAFLSLKGPRIPIKFPDPCSTVISLSTVRSVSPEPTS